MICYDCRTLVSDVSLKKRRSCPDSDMIIKVALQEGLRQDTKKQEQKGKAI